MSTMIRGADRPPTVVIEALCGECKGEGTFYSEEWKEWNEAWNAAEAEVLLASRYLARATVCARVEEVLGQRGVHMPAVPEEYSCPECEGRGRAKKVVTLAELAAMISLEQRDAPSVVVGNSATVEVPNRVLPVSSGDK